MTLRQFVQSFGHDGYVVATQYAIGTPDGTEFPIGYEHFREETERFLDLEGTDDGDLWDWDGNGELVDCNNNTVTGITACNDQKTWCRLVREYEDSDGSVTTDEVAAILAVIRDGSRIDRYAHRGPDGKLYFSPHNHPTPPSVFVQAGLDTTEEQEVEAAWGLLAKLNELVEQAN